MKTQSILFRSLPVALILSGALSAIAQNLSVTNGLQLWLKADAGVTTNAVGGVTQWDDQSGNANTAAQADENLAPKLVNNAINNKPVLRFDGVNDYLGVADSASVSISGDITTFFVVKFDDFANYRAVWAKTAGNLPAPNDWYALPNSGIPRAYRGDGTAVNIGTVDGGTALRAGSYLVVGFDMAGTRLTHYLAAQPTGSGQIANTLGDSDTALLIGTRGDLFTKMKGDIGEILIYDRALSAAERIAVVDYLANKYDIQNLSPTVSVKLSPGGLNVSVGQTITVTATAKDPDGTIARVQFLVNGGLFATATAPPYTARVVLESAGAYEFTARAFDDKDAETTSAAVTLNAGPASTPALTVKGNLQLWLKADEGVTAAASGAVTAWADQSGHTNNAAQADESLAPSFVTAALNGKPVLRFDGVDDYLDVEDSDSVSIAGDITSLFVVKMDDFATYRAIWGKTAGLGASLPAPTDWYTLPGSGIPRLLRGDGTGQNLGSVDSSAALSAGVFTMAGFTAAGTAISHHLDGHVAGTGVINAVLGDGDTPLKIGTRGDLFTKLKGDLAELLIYNSALSDSDRKQVELYLAGKYGLAVTTPVNTLPTVGITAPASGTVLQAPGAVTITANATDADGSVVSVQYFADGVLLSTVTAPPFTAKLNLGYGGNVNISAVATDNLGGKGSSAAVQLCVQGPGAPAGLLGYWPLDGNGEALVGTAGNLVNGPIPAPDRNGTANLALSFDGTLQQTVEVPGGGGLNAARLGTISMWVKWTGPQDAACCGGFGAVLGRQSNGIFSDDIIQLDVEDPDSAVVQWRQNSAAAPLITGSGMVLNDTWRHIAVTFTETSSELFVNGLSEGTGTGGALHNNPSLPLAIGAWNGDGGSYATATIDDVAVWNRVLSAQEVQKLASKSSTPLNLLVMPDCPTIERSGANVIVRWGSGVMLQTATEIGGAWTDLPTAVNPYSVPAAGMKFYRLRSL